MSIMINKARELAIEAHGEQKYGNKPYIYHLEKVVGYLDKHGDEAKIIGYLHDVVEDTRVSKQEIESLFGKFIADCVEILTDEPGSNRKERKIKTYRKMSKVAGKETLALVVKAADRLANLQACLDSNNQNMLEMYKGEHSAFFHAVYRNELCEEIWEKIIEIAG